MKRAGAVGGAVGVAVVVLAVPALAAAHRAHYFPRAHHGCRRGYLKIRVRVRERHHGQIVRRAGKVIWVRRRECYLKGKLRFRTSVDPTFTQSPTNPLAVTYAYSAGAIAGGTNLASLGSLPDGVLNFYSSQTPGGPESLFCAMNVGGSTDGGNCLITYDQTGMFEVTTQYIPNAASAVSETDMETIDPFSTTTDLAATEGTCDSGSPPGYSVPGPYCPFTLTTSVTDAYGNLPGTEVRLLFTPTSGGEATTAGVPAHGSCSGYVTASWVLSPDCNFENGSGLDDTSSWEATATFAGVPGWSASTSPAVSLTP